MMLTPMVEASFIRDCLTTWFKHAFDPPSSQMCLSLDISTEKVLAIPVQKCHRQTLLCDGFTQGEISSICLDVIDTMCYNGSIRKGLEIMVVGILISFA